MSVLFAAEILLAVWVTAAAPPTARPDEAAFSAARESAAKLRADPSKKKFRHHWVNAAQRFERVAQKYEKSERAPEAWFLAAELSQDCYRYSSNADDLAAAARSFERLVERWPRHRLAGEAHAALKKLKASGALAGRKGEPGPGEKKPPKKMLAVAAEKPPAPRAAEPEKAKPAEGGLSGAVAEAIRRVGRAAGPEPLPPREVRPAREAVAPEPDDEPDPAARVTDAVVEGADRPVIEALSERLRDVRVGQATGEERDAATRARLKKIGKDGATNDLTLAEQLGLKVRRVVIDAGHGGHDTGAIGPSGVQEKQVALAISLKLKARLERAGLEVLLTRDDDTYLRLEERTHYANQKKGDLFISVHCNAAPRKSLRGVETYTLNTSGDRYAIRLAARENASSEKGVSDLQYILADLATKANTEDSDRLAEGVQRSLVKGLKSKNPGVRDLGHKEALFFVLLGAKMPAILVETAFLSNPEEEKLLASKDYQDQVAEAIADGVQGFLDERAKLARVD